MTKAIIYDAAGPTTGFWYPGTGWKFISRSPTKYVERGTVTEGKFSGLPVDKIYIGRFNTAEDTFAYISEISQRIDGKIHTSLQFNPPIVNFEESWELAFASGFDLVGNRFANVLFGGGGDDRISGNGGDDRLFGEYGDDRLSGGTGNDRLLGDDGNDRLNGGAGNDFMEGGRGNDTYWVDSARDRVIEVVREGLDTVNSLTSYALARNVENLTLLGTAALNGTGNDGKNLILGNAAANALRGMSGNDDLRGGNGNDSLNGGSGFDVMQGGAGNDAYVVDNTGDRVVELWNQGIDTVRSSVDYRLAANVENLELLNWNGGRGTGNDLANVLTGNDGSDILSGLGGNDSLTGGDGNDRLNGGAGADRMWGGQGDDLYFVDHARDRVSELPGQGADLVLSTISFRLPGNVENLTLGGDQAINGRGNDDANVIRGNSASNVLTGMGGDDTMNGGPGGDDSLNGERGDDRLFGGAGNDTLIGDLGTDTLVGGADADTFLYASTAESTPGAGDTITDFESGLDTLDLALIDADTAIDGNQAFVFIDAAAFSGAAGELRYADGQLQADTDGDGLPDFEIAFSNLVALTAGDILL